MCTDPLPKTEQPPPFTAPETAWAKRLPAADHLQIGASVKLISASALGAELRITPRQAVQFLRTLGVPILWMRNKHYFNMWTFEAALFTLLRPGGPGVQGPACHKVLRSLKGLDPRAWVAELSKDDSITYQMDLAGVLYSGSAREVLERRMRKLGEWLTRVRQSDKMQVGPKRRLTRKEPPV